MRRRIGLYGAHEESLRLLRLLSDCSQVEVVRLYDPDRSGALDCAIALGETFAAQVDYRLTDDFEAFLGRDDLDAVVDDGRLTPFPSRRPADRESNIQVLSPLTARLLWGYGDTPRNRKAELLQALREVVESLELTIDTEELFARMLEIAVGVTGAEGGSLMLLDDESGELHIQVAIGVEPELWPKIRVPLGFGIAGHVAASGQLLHLKGKADRRNFQILRKRVDVESALSVPLLHQGSVLGVLNLHHSTRSNSFSDEDEEFMGRLATLDAQIIHRAREHQALRHQAARYQTVGEIQGLLSGPAPLSERLHRVCRCLASRLGDGIVNIFLFSADQHPDQLPLSASSLEGGGLGADYRVVKGHGIDGTVAQSGRPTLLRGDGAGIAYASLPLLTGSNLLGILTIQMGGGRAPGEDDLLELARAIAEGVARADRSARIEARSTQVNAINETGIRLFSATDLAEVARLATASLSMILDADHAILRIQDPKTQRYRIAAYFGSADEDVQQRLFQLDKQISMEAIRQRTAFLVRDIEDRPDLAHFADDFRSLISAPLKRDGEVIGSLAIYDKVAVDRFFPVRFSDDDLHVFAKFASQVERALTNAMVLASAAGHQSDSAIDATDEGMGCALPDSAYFGTRLHEEIARAAGRDGGLAVAICDIENWTELVRALGREGADSRLHAIVQALRTELREFDVLATIADGFIGILLPEPGPQPAERVTALARAVGARILRDPDGADRAGAGAELLARVAFGYAVHPDDGTDCESLLKHATDPRIQMVGG